MKDKHTINLILISSKWVIPSSGVCSWWINSSFKCFHLFFSGVQFPRPFRRNLHLNHRKALILFLFSLQSFLVILLVPKFFIVVLHDLIHSSRVHQDFVAGGQVSFFSRREVQLNSPFSFELEFCISSFSSAIQSFPFVVVYYLKILRC